MPTAVADIFAAAGSTPAGAVRWGTPVPERAPGNYVVALTDDPVATASVLTEAPIDEAALAHLLDVRPELRLDGRRPYVDELAERLESFWLPEVVLYIGLAGTSVRNRVNQYYKTPLGARRPHAGGWWLKTLTILDELWVHYAATPDDAVAEVAMLRQFVDGLDPDDRAGLHDAGNPAPFANLRTSRGDNKQHGITGATGDLPNPTSRTPTTRQRPRQRTQSATQSESFHRSPIDRSTGGGTADESGPAGAPATSQNVTAADLAAGRIRFPRPAKRYFPSERAWVDVNVRGHWFEAVRWDPRTGPDKERSGVLGFGKGKLDGLLSIGDVLRLTPGQAGSVELR